MGEMDRKSTSKQWLKATSWLKASERTSQNIGCLREPHLISDCVCHVIAANCKVEKHDSFDCFSFSFSFSL